MTVAVISICSDC